MTAMWAIAAVSLFVGGFAGFAAAVVVMGTATPKENDK